MPKVLYIGFGITPYARGGAVTYQQSLAEAVGERGWEPTCFFAAPRYLPVGKPSLKKWSRNGVRTIELYNPPLLHGHANDPNLQCRNEEVYRLAASIVDEVRPDIVHFHELQLHSASLIDLVANRGIPSVKTMHNFYDVCPECNLMSCGREVSFDYDNGRKCADCMGSLPSPGFKRRLISVMPARMTEWLYRQYMALRRDRNPAVSVQVNHRAARYSAGEYLSRRKYFVERLNRLDAIHCSASRAAEIFCSYGVSSNKFRIIPLSAKGLERIEQKPSRCAANPVTFGYIGGRHLHKGYDVLIDAFSMLDQSKAKLIIWDADECGAQGRKLNVEYRRAYNPSDINRVFSEIDIGIVPSAWEEIFGIIGIEFITAGIPVIGSNIGGIPEWLKDGENGFLVPPGNPAKLAAKMELFVQTPGLVAEFQKRIKPWKSFDEHVGEIISLYEEVISR